MSDAYLQVAPDSTGKKVDMDQVSTAAGDTIYRQKAEMAGETFRLLESINKQLEIQTRILRVIFNVLASSNPEFSEADLMTREQSKELA